MGLRLRFRGSFLGGGGGGVCGGCGLSVYVIS